MFLFVLASIYISLQKSLKDTDSSLGLLSFFFILEREHLSGEKGRRREGEGEREREEERESQAGSTLSTNMGLRPTILGS